MFNRTLRSVDLSSGDEEFWGDKNVTLQKIWPLKFIKLNTMILIFSALICRTCESLIVGPVKPSPYLV